MPDEFVETLCRTASRVRTSQAARASMADHNEAHEIQVSMMLREIATLTHAKQEAEKKLQSLSELYFAN